MSLSCPDCTISAPCPTHCPACVTLRAEGVGSCTPHTPEATEDAVGCPRCEDLGRPCRVHTPRAPTAATAPATAPPTARNPVDSEARATTATPTPAPKDLEFQLWRVLGNLDTVAAFERTARWGSPLGSWASEADGTRDRATSDAEVLALWELLQVDPSDTEHPQAKRAAVARAEFLKRAREAQIPGDRPERDPDWRTALRHQQHLRTLESARASAVPGAVLRYLAATAPAGTPLEDVVERVGEAFAHWKLRDAWALAEQRRELARLTRTRSHPKGGRPSTNRGEATPALAKRVLGRALVAWAVAAWRGEPHKPPAWCPREYLPSNAPSKALDG